MFIYLLIYIFTDASTKLFGQFGSKLIDGTALDTNILDLLISKCILSIQDREEITKQVSTSQRNEKLLYILQRQPYDSFYFFVEALKEDEEDFSKIDGCKDLLYEMDTEKSKTIPRFPPMKLPESKELSFECRLKYDMYNV